MKKTIAKIMAAAMVLSTVAAPNALAASYESGTTAKIADLSIAGVKIIEDNNKTGNTVPLILTTGEVTLLSKSTNTAYTFDTVDYVLGDSTAKVTASVYTNEKDPDEINEKTAVTDTTAATTKYKTTVNQSSIGTLLKNYNDGKGKVSKVVTNGKYNYSYSANDLSSWYYFKTNSDGDIEPVFNTEYRTFEAWATRLLAGDTVTGTTKLVNSDKETVITGINASIDVADTTAINDYWNGFVKLQGDNNRYTPIRVHYETTSSSAVYTNNLVLVSSNGSVIATNSNERNAWADRKLMIYDVNSYDLALLKSDYAKGKNLLLNEVYVWTGITGVDSTISAWNDWDDTMWSYVEAYGITSIGKVRDIRSRVFKESKEKLVKAEYVKTIRNGAFRKNKQLKKAILGTEVSGVTKINEKAFYDCKKLATVKIKVKNLKNVGSGAFKNTKSNIIFKLKGNKSQVAKAWKKIKKQAPAKAKYAKI